MRAGAERVVLRKGGDGRHLVCIPFAGGSARSFTRLAHWMGDEWKVTAVQPPPGFAGAEVGIDALASYYLGLLAEDLDGPGLVLGHSLGAAVLQRMARISSGHWPRGLQVVLSAPSVVGARTADLLALDDRALLAEAGRRGMLPDLRVPEDFAVRFLLPDLRRDLAVLRDRAWAPTPVEADVHLLGGTEDRACPPAALEGLGRLMGAASSRLVTGGHLYVVEQPEQTAAALRAIDAESRERELTRR